LSQATIVAVGSKFLVEGTHTYAMAGPFTVTASKPGFVGHIKKDPFLANCP